jgi:hypothetical protein
MARLEGLDKLKKDQLSHRDSNPRSSALQHSASTIDVTACRNSSSIWEANKNQTKQDNLFKIFNSIHNAVLKFKNYIIQVAAFIVDTLIEPLPVIFHDPAGHFGRKTFQSLGTMLVYLGFEVAPEKKIA